MRIITPLLLSLCLSYSVVRAVEVPTLAKSRCNNQSYSQQIHDLWQSRKPIFQRWVTESKTTPYNLYNIQAQTNNLLKYATHCDDFYIIEELSNLYLKATESLVETDQYLFSYFPGSLRLSSHALREPHKMWLGDRESPEREPILVSAQFLYLVSELIDSIADLPPSNQSTVMNELTKAYGPILIAHYQRWIFSDIGPFQVRGWGCKFDGNYVKAMMNHQDYLRKKLDKILGNESSPSYCNAVTDTDMWIIAGVANLVSASIKNTSYIKIPNTLTEKLKAYVGLGANLLQSRVSYTKQTTFKGETVRGVNFDLGAWDMHPDHAFSGYTGRAFPKNNLDATKYKLGTRAGWDLSHARRFVHVFGALNKNRRLLGISFPTRTFLIEMSNQLAYGVFNRDFDKLLFTNYMDGTNGWYRVNYDRRNGFGYGPWDHSISVITGGYGFWTQYNEDLGKVFLSLSAMLLSSDNNIKTHLTKHYEKHFWLNYERPKKIDFRNSELQSTQAILIQFLPSLIYLPSA